MQLEMGSRFGPLLDFPLNLGTEKRNKNHGRVHNIWVRLDYLLKAKTHRTGFDNGAQFFSF